MCHALMNGRQKMEMIEYIQDFPLLINTAKFLLNAEWRLMSVPAVRNEVKYFCCPESYPDVTYTFIIKRRSLFYLTNLIFPMVLMCALTTLSFLLPAESGISYTAITFPLIDYFFESFQSFVPFLFPLQNSSPPQYYYCC